MKRTNNKTKIVATLGVVAGLGLAALPAFSYAAEVSGDVKVETEVTSAIAMRIHSNADETCEDTDSDPTTPDVCTNTYGFIGYNPAEAQGPSDPAATAAGAASQATGLSLSSNQADSTSLYSNIEVRSNTGKFKLEVTDADTDTAMRNTSASTTTNEYIPAGITTTTSGGETVIDPTVAGWALKGGEIASWSAVPASTGTPLTVSSNGTNTTNPLSYSSDITVNYAVASGLTKTDTYSDTITYTATALDSDYSLNDGNMQDFSASAHSSDATGTTYTLTDSRDEKEYTAKKLADGNIWMMQNLELDLPSGQTKRTLTPADSDVAANWDLEDANNWCNQDTDACVNQKLISRTGYTNGETAPTYYYNWYTATAGSGTRSVASGEVNDSICPKGWKLPTTAQFSALDVAYGGTGTNRTDAAQTTNFVNNVGFGFTGLRDAATVYYTTSNADYWSRSANSATYAYHLYFHSGNSVFNPQDNSSKWSGFAVRCVAAS